MRRESREKGYGGEAIPRGYPESLIPSEIIKIPNRAYPPTNRINICAGRQIGYAPSRERETTDPQAFVTI
jgi:hypothetical protein